MAEDNKEAKEKLRQSGFSEFDITVAETTQKILKGDSRHTSEIESILAAVSPEVRDGVVKTFRTNEKLRRLFPEFAVVFDKWPAS
jgi:hypothetical protein